MNKARISAGAKAWAVNSGYNVALTAVSAKDWVVQNPKTAAGVAAAPVVAVVATPLALNAVGFKAAGVAASSVAAGIQAGIGNVSAGSLFASLTSAGTGSAALGAVQGVAGSVVGPLAGGTAYAFRKGAYRQGGLAGKELQPKNEDIADRKSDIEIENAVCVKPKPDAKL